MDKVIVITGGGRGIGAATALLAAEQGYRICINYQSDEQAAHSVLEQVRALGAQAIAVRADVSIEDEVIAMFQRVDSELGRVTALVNNAGTVGQKSRVDEMSEFRILKIMKTNVLAPILCAKHAILRMSPKHGGQGGSIVNVSSVAARLGSPNEYVDYAASKGALDTFTVGLSKEVAGEGIRVNAVRPGYIYTDFHALSGDPDRVSKLESAIPMARGGRLLSVAGIAGADGFAEAVSNGPGTRHQHRAGADFLADPAVQELYPLELRQPVDRGIGEGHGDVGADCAVVLII
jgi:NAD(P)-dependent dehydrogenase (short-subunit alcohol dehydrogenase family)